MKFHYTEQQIKEMQSDNVNVIRPVGTVGKPEAKTFLGVDFPQQFLTVFDDCSSKSLMSFDDIERIEKDDYHPWEDVASGKGLFKFQRDVVILDKDGDKHRARIIKFFDPELDVYTRKILEINISGILKIM